MLSRERYPNSYMLLKEEMVQELLNNRTLNSDSQAVADMYIKRHVKFFVQMSQCIAFIRSNPVPQEVRNAYTVGLQNGMPSYVVYTVLSEAFMDDKDLLQLVDSIDPYTMMPSKRMYIN